MAVDLDQVRKFVQDLLRDNKSQTEREVKAAIGKSFKVNPKEISAGVIRDVRKALGIDRQSALQFAREMLSKDPHASARSVVDTIADKFGVKLGPPDVSRLRPKSAKAGRGGRKAAGKAAKPAAKAAPKAAAKAAPKRRGRPPKAAAAPAAAPAPAAPKRRGRPPKAAAGKPGRKPGRPRKAAAAAPAGGGIMVRYEGSGSPADLAAFFRLLGTKG